MPSQPTSKAAGRQQQAHHPTTATVSFPVQANVQLECTPDFIYPALSLHMINTVHAKRRARERERGNEKRVRERNAVYFPIPFLFPDSGKTSCNKKPITVSFPPSSLNCEMHKPKVQSRGPEGGDEEESEDEKLIIWWRRHGSFGPEKGVQGAYGAQAFILRQQPDGRLEDTAESFS